MTAELSPHEVARRLAARSVELSVFLLLNGHGDGAEWRCGSVAGEPGESLGVYLTGAKTGVWSEVSMPDRMAPNGARIDAKPINDHRRRAFSAAYPISRTIAETCLRDARKLRPAGAMREVLRFAPRHPRRKANDVVEHHPAWSRCSRRSNRQSCGTIKSDE